jgi:EmrB/QacA subfamily drug resistance transporter
MTMKELSKKRLILVLAGVMVGLFLVSMDSTIVSTAMPKIIASLNGMNYYAWPFTAFMLCMTITIPIFGKLSDIYGFKVIYMFGISVFLIGSVLCGVSQNMTQLILFRGMQGIGAGVLVSNTMGLIGILFPPAQRAKFMGIASSMSAIASVIGPTLGGYITDHLNWHWIFFVNVPIGLGAMLIIAFALPSFKESAERKRIDYLGAALLIMGLVPMLLAFTWGGKQYDWNSVQIVGMLSFSVIMLIVFGFVENRAEDPIVPLSFFKSAVFNVSALVMFLLNAGMIGAAIFVPLFAQTVTGSSATNSGMVTTPLMLSLVVGAVLSGVIVSKTHKYKLLSIIGIIIVCLSNVLLSKMGVKTSSLNIAVNMAITGFGIGIVMPIFSVTVQNVFPKSQMGSVSSAIQFFSKMGATIASSILGTIMLTSMNKSFNNLNVSRFPAGLGAMLKNPNALASPEGMSKIKSMLTQNMMPDFGKYLEQVKLLRADAIHYVFVIGIFIVVVALLAVLLLKEIPLNEVSNKDTEIV